jgi:Flp pilus assembly protein TadB
VDQPRGTAPGRDADRAVQQRDDDSRRSRWSSYEGERWWLSAFAFPGGVLATALVIAAVIAIVMEELWIVLAVAAAVLFVGLALKALIDGDWWWN